MTRAETINYLNQQGWEELSANRWIRSEWWAEQEQEGPVEGRAVTYTKAFELAELAEEFITM